jgi:two-component system response regulator
MTSPEIVLIEDNPGDVLLIKLALEENRIHCSLRHFEAGTEAVKALCGENERAVPKAILLDLNTPGIDGFEALARIKESPRMSHVPIAILTSSRARSDKRRAESQGVRYIEKPSQLADFLSSVGQAVKEMLGPPA